MQCAFIAYCNAMFVCIKYCISIFNFFFSVINHLTKDHLYQTLFPRSIILSKHDANTSCEHYLWTRESRYFASHIFHTKQIVIMTTKKKMRRIIVCMIPN